MSRPIRLSDYQSSMDMSKLKIGGDKTFESFCKSKFNNETLLKDSHVGDDKSPSLKDALVDAGKIPANTALVNQFESELDKVLNSADLQKARHDYNAVHKALSQAFSDTLQSKPTPPGFEPLDLPKYLEMLKADSLKEIDAIYDAQKLKLEQFLDDELAKTNGLLSSNTKNFAGLDPTDVKAKILASFDANHKKTRDEFVGDATKKDSIDGSIADLQKHFENEQIRMEIAQKFSEQDAKFREQIKIQNEQAKQNKAMVVLQGISSDKFKGVDINKLEGRKLSLQYPYESWFRNNIWSQLIPFTDKEPGPDEIVAKTEALVMEILAENATSGKDTVCLEIALDVPSNQGLAKYLTKIAIEACMRTGVDPSKIIIKAPQEISKAKDSPADYKTAVVCGEGSKGANDKPISARDAFKNTMVGSSDEAKADDIFTAFEKQNEKAREHRKYLTSSDSTEQEKKETFANIKRSAAAITQTIQPTALQPAAQPQNATTVQPVPILPRRTP